MAGKPPQRFSNYYRVQRMLTDADRVDVMNRLGRAMADPTRSRILLTLLRRSEYPAALAQDPHLTRALTTLVDITLAVDDDTPCIDPACTIGRCGGVEEVRA